MISENKTSPMQNPEPRRTAVHGSGLSNPSWLEKRYYAWLQQPLWDYFLGFIIVAVLMFGSVKFAWSPILSSISVEDRHGLYQTTLAAAVTLAGFSLASVSILVNLLRTPMTAIDRLLDPRQKARLGKVFLAALTSTAVLLCGAVLGFVHDGSQHADVAFAWVEAIYVACVAIALLGFWRIARVLRLLLGVGT